MAVGTVGSGRGVSPERLGRLDLVPALGYQPYPGTLNVRARRPLDLTGPSVEVGGHTFWPVVIADRIDGHLVRWSSDRRTTSYELVAPVRLRDALGLKDRSQVRFRRNEKKAATMDIFKPKNEQAPVAEQPVAEQPPAEQPPAEQPVAVDPVSFRCERYPTLLLYRSEGRNVRFRDGALTTSDADLIARCDRHEHIVRA